MVESSLNIHGDGILYVGDHIHTDVSQSKVHLRWRTTLICRELEKEYAALIQGREHRASLIELINQKEVVGDLFNQLRFALQRRTKGRPAQVPEGSRGGVLLKNLYLSCDPCMRSRMRKLHSFTYGFVPSFTPGSPIEGYGVAKVLDSGHPNFKEGDYVWGITAWEEYTLIQIQEPHPPRLFKIKHTDDHLPLSYYAGVHGKSLLLSTSVNFQFQCSI
ncbi:hypothetical protein Sjap_022961 [Stephania japonica]|uniref:Oxidoreductase N-terminal domain-containing protein n=1 Tax=Stephania japonica TaxID=461633 RepID=A0AAP0EYM9_9MAGN